MAADAKVPATKPAEKFAPRTVAALAPSPARPRMLFLICKASPKSTHNTQTQ